MRITTDHVMQAVVELLMEQNKIQLNKAQKKRNKTKIYIKPYNNNKNNHQINRKDKREQK